MLNHYSPKGKPVQVNLVEGTRGVSASMAVLPEAAASRTDPLNSHLVEMARTIQTADEFVKANASNKLTVIVDQIRYLQEQAKKVLEEAHTDHLLHHAACNFKKTPGNVYYLYERESGQRYFSMLAPTDWGATCPHTFHGAYRLEYDMSWTPAARMEARGRDLDLFEKVFAAQNALTDATLLNVAGEASVFDPATMGSGGVKAAGSSAGGGLNGASAETTELGDHMGQGGGGLPADPAPTVVDDEGNVVSMTTKSGSPEEPKVAGNCQAPVMDGSGGNGRKRQYDVRTPSECDGV